MSPAAAAGERKMARTNMRDGVRMVGMAAIRARIELSGH
jgi:hypothetical protein